LSSFWLGDDTLEIRHSLSLYELNSFYTSLTGVVFLLHVHTLF
jgi:hypothetical protein